MEKQEQHIKVGVIVTLDTPDQFSILRESLSRIGIASKKDKTLWQSCHILHKRGEYAIVHFKELFILDGKESTLTDEDIERRNTITGLLDQWKLCKVVDKTQIKNQLPLSLIKIIPFKEKKDWKLETKYNIGSKKS